MRIIKLNQAGYINFYDDKNFNYEDFWKTRDYEHQSEVIALHKLLANKHYKTAMDYGGGYGRLSKFIIGHADQLYLVEPSTKMLDSAKIYLKDVKNVEYKLLEENKPIPVPDATIDLLVMVRVAQHLPDLNWTLSEIERVLKPNGHAIIELANNADIVNRLRYLTQLKRVPKQPVRIGSKANGISDETPFVNHNPKTVVNELKTHHFKILNTLSVSNFRNRRIKAIFSERSLVSMESHLQRTLAPFYFGPSIFFMIKKVK